MYFTPRDDAVGLAIALTCVHIAAFVVLYVLVRF